MKNKYLLFGITANFYSFLFRIDREAEVVGFSDNNEDLWGKHISNDERICVSPQSISSFGNVIVIILTERRRNIIAIQSQLDQLGLVHILARDFLNTISMTSKPWNWIEEIQYKRIHKFIDISLGNTTTCNFHCAYCYVWRRDGYKEGVLTSDYTPGELRDSLKLQYLGGPCFINICARGETLLSKDIVPMVYALLEEGHVVSIVTNGTIKTRVQELLGLPEELLKRLFFKISFHFEELNKKGLMEQYWNNVNLIKESPCSYTLEITPYDGIESSIEDIKEIFRDKALGAMPHVSIPRDVMAESLELLSDKSIESFSDTWSTFNSKMFELKRRHYGRKIQEYCWAGSWSFLLNLPSGNLKQCYKHDPVSNVFEMPGIFPTIPIAHDCHMAYCFNNHAFIAWGCVPEIEDFSYYDMRDRVDDNGNHWIKSPLNVLMKQKLYENNFLYANHWPDYHILFNPVRERTAVLFNSPDYSNLGDHAIAMSTRQFFKSHFPEIPFTEISCEEYEKENLRIKSQIKDNDLILINGGGNIGSLWVRISDYILDVIDSFPNNSIIIFPQSIYFEESSFGKQEERIYTDVIRKHEKVKIFVRDNESYEKALALGWESRKIFKSPDMALLLRFPSSIRVKGKVGCCFRDDIEGTTDSSLYQQLALENISYVMFDTRVSYRVFLDDRENELRNLITEISKMEIVLTDRLHAMIFCYITSTPCIYLDNVTGKLSAIFGFVEKPDFIKKYTPGQPITEQIDQAIRANKVNTCNALKQIESQFKKIQEVIRSEWDEL